MSPPARSVVVIGVGNQLRGDDAAGLEVARCLRELDSFPHIDVRVHEGEGTGLLELWEGADAVVVVDTVRSNGATGTIHRIDASAVPLPATLRHSSSHAVGPAEAIELARALGVLPRRVVVYGVEGADFASGAELSSGVARAIRGLATTVKREALALAR